jgi:hypothetical protein
MEIAFCCINSLIQGADLFILDRSYSRTPGATGALGHENEMARRQKSGDVKHILQQDPPWAKIEKWPRVAKPSGKNANFEVC